MKTEVYSWRLSSDLKSDLEREARARRVSVSALLDMAMRQWLREKRPDVDDEEEQRRRHAAIASCIGTIAGDNPYRAETVRETIRARLRQKYGR